LSLGRSRQHQHIAPHEPSVLQQFYETGNESLSAKLLLDPSDVEQPAALHFPVFGSNMSQILAADKTDGYLLTKVAESLKTESVIYRSPTDALLNDVIRNMNRPMQFLALDSDFAVVIGSYILIAALAFRSTTLSPGIERSVTRIINDLIEDATWHTLQ
jgi:hypothetical protein